MKTANSSSGPALTGTLLHHVIVVLFVLLAVTGGLLMTVYAPATTTAWGSVHHIQTQVPFGWLIRGLHRFASDAMIVVLVVYLVRLLVTRAYLFSPRLRWPVIIGLLGLTAALAHTGYLLPWDQQAYWGTKVRINIVALAPLIGPALRRALIGGPDLGQAAITRFYTLHVFILPLLFLLLLRFAGSLSRPAGLNPKDQWKADRHTAETAGWGLRRAVASMTLLCVLVGVSWYAHDRLGFVLLAAPADPAAADYPARPEWYALFLFQWLKSFEGPVAEMMAAVVLPGVALTALLSVPYWDWVLRPPAAHRLATTLMILMLAAFLVLTAAAILDDRDPPKEQMAAISLKQDRQAELSPQDRNVLRAWDFNRLKERARRAARRAHVLAGLHGIPPSGPLDLLANDPQTRGPRLFAQHCASCHRFKGHDGLGTVPSEPATASDLAGFASRTWIRGLLANPLGDRYFGLMRKPDGSPAHTRMGRWTREAREGLADDSRVQLEEDFDAVAAYLEDESLHPGRWAHIVANNSTADSDAYASSTTGADDQQLLRGRRFFLDECNQCHSYRGERYGTFHAPEMFGYGSVDWMELMIAEPDHPTRYRNKGREPAQMPSFRDRMTDRGRRLIAQWLHESRNTQRHEFGPLR